MDVKGSSSISRLPQQLLAQVLSHIGPAERMRSCAHVSATWSSAAALATSSIRIRNGYSSSRWSERCCSLSTWLQQHAAAAPITSITVEACSWCPQVLQLPAEQLKLLRKLDLSWVSIAPSAADASSQASTHVLPSALSALTHLVLRSCSMQVSTLPAFTQLQHLALKQDKIVETRELIALAEALPTMQHLTHLALAFPYARDSVVAGVGQLPSLQVLLLHSSICTAASYAALPVALTQLEVQARGFQASPASTPGLTHLTALQWLEVQAEQLDITTFGNMRSLQHLVLDVTRLQVAETQPCMATLAGLTALQHLALSVKDALGLDTPADVSALTASTHLTLLKLQGGVVDGAHYDALFPAGRKLPHLRSLHASMGLVSRFSCVYDMVKCCVNLDTLDLTAAGEGDWSWDYDYPPGYPVYLLGSLPLRALELDAAAHVFDITTWKSLAHLTILERLNIKGFVPWQSFGGVAALAACKQLTNLVMEVGDDYDYGGFGLANKAPAGSPPDVWQRLPAAAMELALKHYDAAVDLDCDQQDALVCLARSAAGETVRVQQEHKQLQQELVDLRQLYQAQQQEQQQLHQELAVLRKRDQQRQQEQEHLQAQQQRQQQELDKLRALLTGIRPQLQGC